MIDHIALVFAAEGLTPSEKLLLLAYANHADHHGYCWPSVERLADETGMSERTVKRTNAALRAKNLIKSVHRTNPKTGLQITNLTRLNVPLLESMRRTEHDYDDDLVEAITFDEAEQETFTQVSQGCQSDTPGVSDWHPRGVNLTPKPPIEPPVEPPPSYLPRHTGPASAAAEGLGGGRGEIFEEEIPPKRAVPAPRPAADGPTNGGEPVTPPELLQTARELLSALPDPIRPGGRVITDLAPAVAEALAAGWTPTALTEHLTADLPERVRSVRGLLAHRLNDLPAPPAGDDRPTLPPRCDDPRHDPHAPSSDRWLYDEEGRIIGKCECARPVPAMVAGVCGDRA